MAKYKAESDIIRISVLGALLALSFGISQVTQNKTYAVGSIELSLKAWSNTVLGLPAFLFLIYLIVLGSEYSSLFEIKIKSEKFYSWGLILTLLTLLISIIVVLSIALVGFLPQEFQVFTLVIIFIVTIIFIDHKIKPIIRESLPRKWQKYVWGKNK